MRKRSNVLFPSYTLEQSILIGLSGRMTQREKREVLHRLRLLNQKLATSQSRADEKSAEFKDTTEGLKVLDDLMGIIERRRTVRDNTREKRA